MNSTAVKTWSSGCCRTANPYLFTISPIDRRSQHHLVARLDAVTDLDLGPEVAHFGDLAAVVVALFYRLACPTLVYG